MRQRARFGGLAVAAFVAACTWETPPSSTVPAPEGPREETAGIVPAPNPLRNVYFGDLHVHTRLSYDAYIFNVRATPDDAYAYARGGTIGHPLGFDLHMNSGPLDFLAVTDHAEYLGVLGAIDTPGTVYSRVPYAGELFSSERGKVITAFTRFSDSLDRGEVLPELSDMSAPRSAWREVIDSAERNNEPGRFTTFIGFEFTSHPGYRNLHRNVVFAGSRVPEMPFSSLESQNPEDLWRWLDHLRTEGIEALAIPHNSNASDGTMFERTMWDGEPIGRSYAESRARNEPLVEIIQTKGQSETMPLLSPNDESAGFEVMDSYVGTLRPVTRFAGGYVRDALRRGLEIEDRMGANPYRMGFVGASDSHNAAGSFEENNYFSKVGVLDGLPVQRGSVLPPGTGSWDDYYASRESPSLLTSWGSAGLTGVWAEENTRASLFAALRRKETFATSGTRIRVRFFAGYGLERVDLSTAEGLRTAYATGVPMGGNLAAKTGEEPAFIVIAMRDIHSAPLQRIQIVKGWTDDTGESSEKVYDIACSDDGAVDPATRRCPDNGATVDLRTCTYSQDRGDTQIRGEWTDPDFDPQQNAFYYVRVLEDPTCRWSTWDAIRARIEPNPRLAKTIQERAYTSPIWYLPERAAR
jgi:Protein of unknown function (DUF3604)